MPAQPLSPGSPQAPPLVPVVLQPQPSADARVSAAQPSGSQSELELQPEPGPAPLWLQRTSLLILVLFCIYLGGLVAVLPWWAAVWDHNSFLLGHPRLWAILRLGPVRGVISGCGLLDIWIGVSEAIHYRDQRA